jgi:hypothetical protein
VLLAGRRGAVVRPLVDGHIGRPGRRLGAKVVPRRVVAGVLGAKVAEVGVSGVNHDRDLLGGGLGGLFGPGLQAVVHAGRVGAVSLDALGEGGALLELGGREGPLRSSVLRSLVD